MAIFDNVVVGTGPAGCACARTLAKRGKKVLLVERGASVPFTDCFGEYSGCAIIARATRLRRVKSSSDTCCSCLPLSGEYSGNAVGGMSAVNFGVWLAPSLKDIELAFPNSSMRTDKIISSFLKEIDHVIANDSFEMSAYQHKALNAMSRNKWGISNETMQRDDTDQCSRLWTSHAAHTVYARALRNDLGKRQTAWDSLIDGMKDTCSNVTTVCNFEVWTMKLDARGNWVLETKDKSKSIIAKNVFLAAGVLETPAILMRSFGNKLSTNVGKHIQNHEQCSTIIPASSTESNLSSYWTSTHPISFIKVNSDNNSSVEFMESTSSFSAISRLSNACTARSFFRATLCPFLPPHGLCLLACYNDARVQVFRDTSDDGQIRLLADESPFFVAPSHSKAKTKSASDFKSSILKKLEDAEFIGSNPLSSKWKSAWHYVGSVRVPGVLGSFADSGVDLRARVLDNKNRPLFQETANGAIFVADASLARRVSVVNTMSMAAYCGVVAAMLAMDQ